VPGTDARAGAPALIVGHGLIGGAVRARLAAAGMPAVSIGRRRSDAPGYLAQDLASEAGRTALQAVVQDLRPSCVVLAHGPSDVTWIDQHPADAAAVHCGVAAIVARCGAPCVLVSTDNVFSGQRGGNQPDDPAEPGNAYGRIKASAESLLLAGGRAMVLRVSLVYGWAGPRQRATFAQRCLDAAGQGRPMSAPTDQIFTPIHVRDVATVVAAACQPAGPAAGIHHLAGPAELSRYDFARLAYRLAGADTGLVRPCLRQDTEWACRPRFSCLACGNFARLTGLATWRPMAPDGGLREMLATRPAGRGDAARPDPSRPDTASVAAQRGAGPR
jgi:dTDP-4-dehydrorhamnose reductase